MEELDPRVIRITLEIAGEMRVFEGMSVRVRGQKTANPLQNTCEVTIYNLTTEARNFLLTETSPFNKNRKPKKLIVEAGRVRAGLTRVFTGEVVDANPSQPPDIALELKAQTGAFAKGDVRSRSGEPQQSLSSLAKLVAGDLGLALDFQAADKQISNYSFSGAALRQVDALAGAGGVDVFVDDDTLVVKDRGKALSSRIRILNADTGMVGIPEVTEKGIKARYLFDGNTVLGGTLEISSALNPSLDGQYTIYALDFDLASDDTPFYYTASASRPRFDEKPKGK